MCIARVLNILIVMLAVVSSSAWAADTRDLTLFTIASRADPAQRFTVATDDPELIQLCRDQLAHPEIERTLHVHGRLAAGHGGVNMSWSWNLEPDNWDLVEVSIELCDGRPSDVEKDPAYWLGTVGNYCP